MLARILLLGGVVCAAVVLASQPSTGSPGSVSAQGVERVKYRHAPPTCAQSIINLGLEGQPVHCIEPPAPTYDPPRMHGRYRLFPGSYVGPLTYEDTPDTAPPGVVSDELEAITTSSIYVEPAWLPEGYSLSSISTQGYDAEHVIAAEYTGPGEAIRINQVRRFTRPIDVIMPADESYTVFETPVLEETPAVLRYPKPGPPPASGLTVLSFVEGDVETTVLGRHLDPNAATAIALSLICGSSCVTPPANDSPAIPDTETTRSSEATQSSPVFNDYRVVVGLDAVPVKITTTWHGFDYPGAPEAALDLAHADGPEYTKFADVYAYTWREAGSSTLRFTTDDYRHDPSYCDGRYVDLYDDAGGNLLGRLTYVHLDEVSMAPEGDTWVTGPAGWTIHYLGYVAETQDDRCGPADPGYVYYAHLHQGQAVASQPVITYNTTLPAEGEIFYQAWDPIDHWMHKVTFTAGEGPDTDGDGCTDVQEVAMSFNPNSAYDFFDVPVPARPDPQPNGPRNRAIDQTDVLAVLFYVGTADGGPPNGNGVDYDTVKDSCRIWGIIRQDGVCYDRTPSPPPNPPWGAGPPDKAVEISDVLIVLAQSGLTCAPDP